MISRARVLASRLISSYDEGMGYFGLQQQVLDGQYHPFGVDGELFFIGGDKGVEALEGLGLGDGVALDDGLEQELVVGGVEGSRDRCDHRFMSYNNIYIPSSQITSLTPQSSQSAQYRKSVPPPRALLCVSVHLQVAFRRLLGVPGHRL